MLNHDIVTLGVDVGTVITLNIAKMGPGWFSILQFFTQISYLA